jgi:hypothetical protein
MGSWFGASNPRRVVSAHLAPHVTLGHAVLIVGREHRKVVEQRSNGRSHPEAGYVQGALATARKLTIHTFPCR